MKIFSNKFFINLTHEAHNSPRKRFSVNIHKEFKDPCQRLFNVICLTSYIQPHRHSLDPKDECLIAIKGLFALIIFDDSGSISKVLKFGSESYRSENINFGVEIPSTVWHTVISLVEDSVLFEVKRGPFNPTSSKDFAIWAPSEGSLGSDQYLSFLKESVCHMTDE